MRETDILNPKVKEGLPKRTELIKRLIESRQFELNQRGLILRGNWNIVISLLTFFLLLIKTIFDLSK